MIICNIDGCDNSVIQPKSGKRAFRCNACRHLMKRYGVTYPEKKAMVEAVNSRCEICNNKVEMIRTGNTKACIDHDHLTGEIRGILCDDCNRGLGYFRDNLESLLNAARYLEGD